MNKIIPHIFYKEKTVLVEVKVCPVCNKEFERGKRNKWEWNNKRKYCSVECSKVGLAQWRGEHIKKYGSRNGKAPANKGVFTSNSYSTIHKWISSTYKKAGYCSNCRRKTRTSWALVRKDKVYTRDRGDYAELCYFCHNNYDRGNIEL